MLTQISSAIGNPAETASTLSTTISSKLNDNYPNLSKNLTDNYFTLSSKFNDNYNKFSASYPGISSGLTNTKTTITYGTNLIYSLPTSIGDKVNHYTSKFEPVNTDGSKEREIARTPPNDNLGENVIPLKGEREEIVNHVLDLYNFKLSEECFKYYDNDVAIDSPIMFTTGLSNLKAQFIGMKKIFVNSTTVEYKVVENTPNVLKINLNQKYTIPYVGRAVVQSSQIILEFNENKISKHIDCWADWNEKPIGEGGILRKGVAKLVSVCVKVPEN